MLRRDVTERRTMHTDTNSIAANETYYTEDEKRGKRASAPVSFAGLAYNENWTTIWLHFLSCGWLLLGRPFILGRGVTCSSSLSLARSVKPNPPFSSSYEWIKPSRSPREPNPILPELRRRPSPLRRVCMLRLVWRLAIASVGTPSSRRPFSRRRPSGSSRERLRRYTPVKMTRNPHSSDIVLTASVVLKPRKSINDAHKVAVVNVT